MTLTAEPASTNALIFRPTKSNRVFFCNISLDNVLQRLTRSVGDVAVGNTDDIKGLSYISPSRVSLCLLCSLRFTEEKDLKFDAPTGLSKMSNVPKQKPLTLCDRG